MEDKEFPDVTDPRDTGSYGNSDVNDVLEAFATAFGTTKHNKYDRYAAHRLAKKHGADNIIKAIRLLSMRSNERYSPTVNNVMQLENKWVSVVKFLYAQEPQEEEIDI